MASQIDIVVADEVDAKDRVYRRMKIPVVPFDRNLFGASKKRTCLKCDRAFLSVGGARLCMACRRANEAYGTFD